MSDEAHIILHYFYPINRRELSFILIFLHLINDFTPFFQFLSVINLHNGLFHFYLLDDVSIHFRDISMLKLDLTWS